MNGIIIVFFSMYLLPVNTDSRKMVMANFIYYQKGLLTEFYVSMF